VLVGVCDDEIEDLSLALAEHPGTSLVERLFDTR
jgi:hypothetical protein